MEIVCDKPEHLGEFVRLNELWIREHFSLESADRALAADPGAIARRGGHTLCALKGSCVVGAVALFRRADDEFELARMAVDPRYRGRGIGRALGLAALDKALGRGARLVHILSNTALTPATSLYRSLGFRIVRTGKHPEYSRGNVVMEKPLEQNQFPPPAVMLDAVPGLAGKRFRLVENSAAGSAGTDTILSFVSDDEVIVGRYEGGSNYSGRNTFRRSECFVRVRRRRHSLDDTALAMDQR